MNNLTQAIWVEINKARRAPLPLFALIGFMIVPLISGVFMLVFKDPELASRLGIITSKAYLVGGEFTWPAMFNFLNQAVTTGGIILYSFVGSWVFGREFADRTVKDLLALPTGRGAIVLAKFVVILGWSLLATTLVYLCGLGMGLIVGLPPLTPELFWPQTAQFALATTLTMVLVTPISFLASAGRGYLPALGGAVLAIVMAQITVVLGWGEYFPWAVPALLTQGVTVGAASYIVVLVASLLGILGTIGWWELADQTG